MEKRVHQRFRVFKGGSILSAVAPAVACVVRNISEGGACIEVPAPAGVPNDFSLYIGNDGVRRGCHVAWRADRRIGVQFV